jgi:hypothetical protein
MDKIFIHEGMGHYIGSVVIVVAKSEESATKIVRESLDSMGLCKEPIKELDVMEIQTSKVIYEKSGDY